MPSWGGGFWSNLFSCSLYYLLVHQAPKITKPVLGSLLFNPTCGNQNYLWHCSVPEVILVPTCCFCKCSFLWVEQPAAKNWLCLFGAWWVVFSFLSFPSLLLPCLFSNHLLKVAPARPPPHFPFKLLRSCFWFLLLLRARHRW